MVFTHIRSAYSFAGYQCPLKESKVVVMQVPYDGTTSYRCGTRDGPHAILTASRQLEFFDPETGKDYAEELGIHTMAEMEPDMGSAEGTVKRVEEMATEVLGAGKFPILLGGEHSVSVGMVNALAKKYKNLSVLQIDAHADLRDEYEGTRFNHACAMRRIRERVGTASQVGIRSVCKEESDYIKQKRLGDYVQWGASVDVEKVLSQLGGAGITGDKAGGAGNMDYDPDSAVYVTIDLDGFDPSECPGVGTPEPGGLRWAQGLELLKAVAAKKRIVGFDIVELLPLAGSVQSDFFAAKLAYKLLGYSFFSRGGR